MKEREAKIVILRKSPHMIDYFERAAKEKNEGPGWIRANLGRVKGSLQNVKLSKQKWETLSSDRR